MIVYLIEVTYTDSNNENGLMYDFRYMTNEPIETCYSRLLNIICNTKNISYIALTSGYLELIIHKISEVK